MGKGVVVPDVVILCRDLIRINTSNPTHPESPAANYVAGVLGAHGLTCERFEPAPGRVSLVTRLAGQDPSLSPLLVHTHLDTVPAIAEDWSHDPFGGDVEGGFVWGRGALDMKGMVAAVVATVCRLMREGQRPRRDVILAFFADEEAGGGLGAGYVVREHPDLFAGCEEAIGEVGGFSVTLGGKRRCYLVSAAEKGVLWARLSATGTAGHASMVHDDNAVTAICAAVARVSEHSFPERPPSVVETLYERLAEFGLWSGAAGVEDLAGTGSVGRMLRAGSRDTVNPTLIAGGYKVNVVPQSAHATIDGRFLPGHGDQFASTIRDLVGAGVEVETIFWGPALEAPWDTSITGAFEDALRGEDPDAVVLPYMSTAFTDAKWLSTLGIRCYGFSPMRMPPGFDFTALFHGVDERVPESALRFCQAVLTRLLLGY